MSARDNISVTQFGMKPHRPGIEKDVDSRMVRSEFQTRRIRLDSAPIRATQTTVSSATVEGYSKRPRNSSNKGQYGERPELVHRNGENVVWNGHHRIAAAVLRGQKSMTVDFQKLPSVGKRS